MTKELTGYIKAIAPDGDFMVLAVVRSARKYQINDWKRGTVTVVDLRDGLTERAKDEIKKFVTGKVGFSPLEHLPQALEEPLDYWT